MGYPNIYLSESVNINSVWLKRLSGCPRHLKIWRTTVPSLDGCPRSRELLPYLQKSTIWPIRLIMADKGISLIMADKGISLIPHGFMLNNL